MPRKVNRLTLFAIEYLADGEWHDFEVLSRKMVNSGAMEDGKAYRKYERMLENSRKQYPLSGKRPKSPTPDDKCIKIGARRIVYDTLRGPMYETKKVIEPDFDGNPVERKKIRLVGPISEYYLKYLNESKVEPGRGVRRRKRIDREAAKKEIIDIVAAFPGITKTKLYDRMETLRGRSEAFKLISEVAELGLVRLEVVKKPKYLLAFYPVEDKQESE